MNWTRTLAAAFAAALLLPACGGGGDPEVPPNVTATGASVVSDDGKATLTVPAGAVATPQRIALLAAPQTQVPAGAAILPGSVFRIEGNGGALGAPATLSIDTGTMFPAHVSSRTDRKRALGQTAYFEAPKPQAQPLCDLDGDGLYNDPEDMAIRAGGATCFGRPRLVDLSRALGHVGYCDVPDGPRVSCEIASLQAATLGVVFDAVAPTVSVESFDAPVQPAKVTSVGSYRLRVAASDNTGVSRVDFYLGRQREGWLEHKLVSLTAVPYEASFAIAPEDAGAIVVYAEAFDAHGNSTSAGVLLDVALGAAPVDTTPPVVTLAASGTAVQVGQGTTLIATATDLASAIARVEFFRGGTKVGEDLSPPFEYVHTAFAAGDVGSFSYTARAFDTAGNAATSAPVVVVVSSATIEAWVNPASGSDGNAGSAAAPFKTIGKAFAVIGTGGTAWLQNGSYTSAGEGLQDIYAGLALPAGAALKAVNEGGAMLGITLQVPAGGSVSGLAFDVSQVGRVLATGGTLAMSRTRFLRIGTTTGLPLEISGAARVFVDSGGSASFNHVGTGVVGFARVLDQAELHMTGGQLDGLTGQPQAIYVGGDTARLALTDVTVTDTGAAWVGGEGVVYVGGTANRVDMTRTRFDMRGIPAACIQQDRQIAGAVTDATRLTLVDTVIEGCAEGVQLREGKARFEMTGGAIRGNTPYWGIHAGQIGFDSSPENQYGSPSIRLRGVTIADNFAGGVFMNHGGELDIDGGVIASPASAIELLAVKRYTLKLRNANLQSGSLDALRLDGDSGSVFDLGTAAAAGGNTLTSTVNTTTLLRIGTAAGVRVDAVGNRWRASVQGADTEGRYGLGSSACGGANPCDVTEATAPPGTNFRFLDAGSGASLRLAGP
jgi:hypothetical protein